MSHALVAKDALLLRRETFVKGLFIVIVVLVAASVATGLERERVFNKERAAALETDRSVWMSQGDRNPHSAAHFARYAFRPASPLALVDPGVSDFAGLAIWMEAHYQDPAVFRRAEDGGDLGRYTQLTPAFVVLTVTPLLVFLMLFGSIAGEREDGTLRQLLASGVGAREFFMGKLFSGLRITLIAFSAVFVPAAVISVVFAPAEAGFDAVLRLGLLYLAFCAYLAVFVAIAIAGSSLCRSRQAAFLLLTCTWALMTVIVPRFAADIATTIYPQPLAIETTASLGAASYKYWGDEDLQEAVREEVLEQYGVETVEELPINFDAYALQVSEDLAEPEFDRIYAELDQRYASQESVMRWFSLLTPAVATARLSQGLAGTDRVHQGEFAQAAESHRREMIQLLNEDYMYNAGDAGSAYTANEEVWAEFEDLPYQVPAIGRVAQSYALDGLLLALWVVAAMLSAYWLVARAVRGEERAA